MYLIHFNSSSYTFALINAKQFYATAGNFRCFKTIGVLKQTSSITGVNFKW